MVIQKYKTEELNRLEEALASAKWINGDRFWNRFKWLELQRSAIPIMKRWRESFDIKDDTIGDKRDDLCTVKRVYYSEYAKNLLLQYCDKCEEYCNSNG